MQMPRTLPPPSLYTAHSHHLSLCVISLSSVCVSATQPSSFIFFLLAFWLSCCSVLVHAEGPRARGSGPVVKKEERRAVVSTEYGEISAIRIDDAVNGSYLLHFFSLEPNSLVLPLLLNADMVFYVRSGRGRLSWSEEGEEAKYVDLKRGDVYRLEQGSVFYILTEGEQQHRLKINAIFPNSNDDLREPAMEPYSSIQELVLSFDRTILQSTFKVSDEVIDELLGGTKPPAITNADQFCRGFPPRSRSCDLLQMNKKKKKEKEEEEEKKKEKKDKKGKGEKLFNLFEEEKAVENCNGWTTTVTEEQLSALEGTSIGLFMVNLKAGSMVEPHWNTMDTEIAIVLEGRGMVRVSAPRMSETEERGEGRNWRYEVEEGDVFAVPRFHAAAEMAFNNGSLVFMGFSRMSEKSKAQFIAGEDSVLQVLNRDVLQILFNVRRTTLDQILAPREDSVISACTSCAEEEVRSMEEGGGPRAGSRGHGGEKEREREREEDEREREREREREQEEREREEEEGGRRREREQEERETEEEEGGRRREEEEEGRWRRGREEEEERWGEREGEGEERWNKRGRRILGRN